MLPSSLRIPLLPDPYAKALSTCLEYVFDHYDTVGILATGTIIRGTPDKRSDLDIHVLHSQPFRQRLQLTFEGVPAEVFVNPPYRVAQYFEEDRECRRPIAPHMYATGVIVFDPTGELKRLTQDAQAILDNPPEGPSELSSTMMRYSVATEFEDVEDLADSDPFAASVLLGGVIRKLVECRTELEPGWLPRSKDLMKRLRDIDPESAQLAESASSAGDLHQRMAAARKLCLRVTGAEGFFEWESPREEVLP